MSGTSPSAASKRSFCTKCGERLSRDAKFCAACGARVGGGTAAVAGTPAAHTTALAVFTGFLAVGGIAFWLAERASEPPVRSVPGSPTAPSGAEAAQPSELPPSHPPLELPAEAITFLAELTKSAEAAPDDLDAWQKLARARYRAALIDPSYVEPAESAIDHVLELDAKNLEAVRTRGNLAYDTRDYKTAQTYFERYLSLDPNEPSVKTDLASTLLFDGKRDEAKALYREVIAKSPDFVQAHLNLGIALHADGDREGSKASLQTALANAKTPEQKSQVERVIALAEQRMPPSASTSGAKPGSAGAPAGTNAATAFQRDAEKILRAHSIVGPKIVSFEWSGPSTANVVLKEFPMQAMPPVMRNKFKSRINEELAALATRDGVAEALRLDLTDAASGERMDTLDGKEWIGAFDEGQAQ